MTKPNQITIATVLIGVATCTAICVYFDQRNERRKEAILAEIQAERRIVPATFAVAVSRFSRIIFDAAINRILAVV